jgi:hypothetical protein
MGSFPRLDYDETFRLQYAEALPDRGAADAEFLAQFIFDKLFPWFQFAGDDRLK